jgi:hypothetical protein
MMYALLAVLALAVVLLDTNEFLRGLRKVQIDAFITLLMLSIIGAGFVTGGWKRGSLLLGASFLLVPLLRPLGARLAARLLSDGKHDHYIGLPPRLIQSISSELGRKMDRARIAGELGDRPSRCAAAEEALYEYCQGNSDVRAVLDEFGATAATLSDLYWRLMKNRAGQWCGGHWVPASAIVYPHTLRFLLGRYPTGVSAPETTMALIRHFDRGTPLPEDDPRKPPA